ncbi:MAG: hypothetical protein J6Q54_08505 [Oscillospiraceae bacterium]|nr:hypothetical protein [Oscillospiraceae bacterium]
MKKFLSVLLAAVMTLSLFANVFADSLDYEAGVEDSDFGSAIRLVALTITEPAAGVPVTDAVPTPAAGAKYKVTYRWLDGNTLEPVTTETFEAGGRYRLEYEVIPNLAYWFENTTEICLNNVYSTPDTLESRLMKGYYEWTLIEYLHTIRFPQFPEPKIGDPGVLELEDAQTDGYVITCQYTDPNTYAPAKQVVEGKCYMLQMIATPKPGFAFVPDTEVYVDGEKFDGLCSVGTTAVVTKLVGFGLQEVTDIAIQIEEPRANAALATTAEALTSGFTIGEFITWYELHVSPDWEYTTGVATYAEKGKSYCLQFYAYAEDGYRMAEKLNITVNGKPARIYHLENYGSYSFIQVNMGEVGDVAGDLNGDSFLNTDDVVALLLYLTMPDMYPLQAEAEFTKDGVVNVDDAVQLLLHITMPDLFPL